MRSAAGLRLGIPPPWMPAGGAHSAQVALRAVTPVPEYVAEHAEEWLSGLLEWLRIPSQSGDPAHAPDVRRSAEWLATALRAAGFPTVEMWETGGHPAVFAEWPSHDADAPEVLVYGHHDV